MATDLFLEPQTRQVAVRGIAVSGTSVSSAWRFLCGFTMIYTLSSSAGRK